MISLLNSLLKSSSKSATKFTRASESKQPPKPLYNFVCSSAIFNSSTSYSSADDRSVCIIMLLNFIFHLTNPLLCV